jgi:site-specific DNA-methyltransferase (adenine-specific)
MDAVEWLRALPAGYSDLCITDPPYESLEKWRKLGTTTRLKASKQSSNKWFPIFPNRRFGDLFSEIYRVLKRDSHFYCFSDSETMFAAVPIAEEIGFRFWKPLVWDKVCMGMGYHYRARYEFVLFFEKGKRKINDLSVPDILESKRIWRGYPTEKPVDLLKTLIRQSSEKGELVIDPFCGSGSTGEAAVLLGRDFHGCDCQSTAVDLTNARVERLGK